MTDCIVFWQRMLTPHMTELARELAQLGVQVHYVAEEALSAERRAMGWVTGDLAEIGVHFVDTPEAARELVDRLPAGAVHITQGVRANGLVADAQKRIMARGARHYPIMEKVDLRRAVGRIKPLVYALRLRAVGGAVEGLLAIGETTPGWVERLAPRSLRVFPFAYFLGGGAAVAGERVPGRFRFAFVGGLIERKRVDLLLDALAGLSNRAFELEIVGDGPERAGLEVRANTALPGQVTFVGTRDMAAAIERIARADCLVLPSDHDGWGAVVSEAQIHGTPAICSSECGVAGTVRASGAGAVFAAGDTDDLRRCLSEQLELGPLLAAERARLADWARCLMADAGARYLLEILNSDASRTVAPPWELAKA